MADFALAIREMDVATSGFCIEIVELRPALAEAVGVKEERPRGDSVAPSGSCTSCVAVPAAYA